MSQKNKNASTAAKSAAVENNITENIQAQEGIEAENDADTAAAAAETKTEDDIKSVLSDINESMDSLADNIPSEQSVRTLKSELSLTDKIPCKSLYHGKLVYISPTNGAKWIWNDYGAVQHISLSELETMNNHKQILLSKPMLVIQEASVVEYFNFGDTYRKVASFNNFGKLLETGDVEIIRKKVKELIEVGMRDSVIAEVRKSRKDNKLVNINVINMLNLELKTNIE